MMVERSTTHVPLTKRKADIKRCLAKVLGSPVPSAKLHRSPASFRRRRTSIHPSQQPLRKITSLVCGQLVEPRGFTLVFR
jgi:hypothetical protein